MTTLERIQAEALALSTAERSRLVERLLASLDEDDEVVAAWALEVERRIDALERGELSALPVEEVIAAARARLTRSGE